MRISEWLIRWGGFLLSIIGFLITVLATYQWHIAGEDKRERKRFQRWVLVAAILMVMGNVWTAMYQDRSARRLRDIAEDSLSRSKKVLNQTEETLAYISGGDSIAYFDFETVGGRPRGKYMVYGKYPVEIIVGRIIDLTQSEKYQKNGMDKGKADDAVTSYLTEAVPFTITPQSGLFNNASFSPSPREGYKEYLVRFAARNGNVVQVVIMKKKGSSWAYTYGVFRLQGNLSGAEEIKELSHVDPDLPKLDRIYAILKNRGYKLVK